MRIPFLIIMLGLGLSACKFKQTDIAKAVPPFPIQIERFDSAFFEMDTSHMQASLNVLQAKYPNFTNDFITKVLMIKSIQDTQMIKTFMRMYMPVYQEAIRVNAIQIAKPHLEEGFKYLHYYFPKYSLSHKATFFVGPLGLYKNVLLKDADAIGLQMYLGANSNWYQSETMQFMAPYYERRKFEPRYIAVDAVENIIDEIQEMKEPENLLNQLVAAGKKQYLLKACLPSMPDSILFGYTNMQLSLLKKEASSIWDYVLAEQLLYTTNESDIIRFMQEGAENEIFGEGFPGNTGKYIGYQIVDAWMQKKAKDSVSMEKLLATPAQQIFNGAKYAP